MSDNLKAIGNRVDADIDPAGAPGSILAQNHNEILKDVLVKVGKYYGSPYSANKLLTVFPSGSMSWNGNALNDTNEFTITVSKLTSDLNDFGEILSRIRKNDLLKFKDFVGRSVDLVFQSFVADIDGSANDIYNITVKGVDENINYTYQDAEVESCLITVSAPYIKNISGSAILNSSSSSISALGGSEQQPNLVGIETHLEYFTGDGIVDTYNIVAPFIIDDLSPRITIRINVLRYIDGILIPDSTLSGVTVNSGFGTNTINVTIPSPPSVNDLVEATVYGINDEATSVPNLISTLGYDNSVQPIQSSAFGAHGIITSGDGHNVILGGSYGRIFGSFSSLDGKGIYIGRINNSTIYAYGFGNGIQLDGANVLGIGRNVKINGTSSLLIAVDSEIDGFDYVYGFGRGVEGVSNGEIIQGASTSFADKGLFQTRQTTLGLQTSNSTLTFMNLPVGGSSILLPDDSSAIATVKVTALDDGQTKVEAWEGTFLVTKIAGISRVNNSTGDVVLTSVNAIGTPSFTCAMRAIAGDLKIRVSGEAALNVRWVAEVRMSQTKW